MQTARRFHNQIVEAFAKVAINSARDAENFDAANAVFDANAFFGYFLVSPFLLRSQFLSFWLLRWLISRASLRFITLKTGIFPNLAPFGKRNGLFVRAFFAVASRAQYFDFSRAFLAEDIVFERMPR